MAAKTMTIKVNRPQAAKPEAATAAPAKPGVNDPVTKLAAIERWANTIVVGRAAVVRLLVLGVVARQNCLFLGPPGCLTGDTMIRVNRAGKGWSMRLDQLVARETGNDAMMYGKSWDRAIPTMVARAEDGLVRLCRLGAAWVSGVKEVFELRTESGRSIRATADHPFMTENGFSRLGDLVVGDYVLVDVGMTANGRTKIQYPSRYTRYHPRQRRAKDGFRVLEHQLVAEAEMNGMDLDELLDVLRNDEARAATLRYLDPGAVVHHKDGNPKNNAADNLEVIVSQAEHARRHAAEITPNVLGRVARDKIVSITARGEEMTYDIEVDGDPHNFIANGFVVHNTAKTLAVEQIASTFTARYFSTMLTKFSKPAEVFGPTDISRLEHGEYHYLTDGYLPWCEVGVVDEVFKGSSAICNAFLTVANERRFRNGNIWEACPTRMLVGMSNEFPEDPATLAAFFDRFPLKAMVKYVEGNEFSDMLKAGALNGHAPSAPCTLAPADLDELDARVAACVIPEDVFRAVSEIRDTLNARGVVISDRRYVQALKLLKGNAVLDGRARVSKTDLKVLEAVCWNSEQDAAVIKTVLPDFLNPLERELKEITDEVYAERAKVLAAGNYDGSDKARTTPDNVAAVQQAAKSLATIRGIRSKIDIIGDMVESDDDRLLMDEAIRSIAAIDDTVRAVAQGKAGLDRLKETEAKDVAGA